MTDTDTSIAEASQSLDAALAIKQVELDDALRQISLMRRDWKIVNTLMNEYADNKGWCEEYDETVELWNDRLSLLALESRRREYYVSVKVTLTYYTSVSVTASTAESATSQVNDLSTNEVMSDRSWNEYDEAEWDVSRVEVA